MRDELTRQVGWWADLPSFLQIYLTPSDLCPVDGKRWDVEQPYLEPHYLHAPHLRANLAVLMEGQRYVLTFDVPRATVEKALLGSGHLPPGPDG